MKSPTDSKEKMIAADGLSVMMETHGCKLNQADTQLLSRELGIAGYTVAQSIEEADVYVLNTCTVTHVADRKARQAVRAAKRRNPNSIVVVTGCYAQRSPDDLSSMPEIDLVAGNVSKPSLAGMIGNLASGPDSACAVGSDEALAQVLRIRSRAMVKIQEGCDQVCAYCIVPTVRGRERSIPVDDIVATAKSYADMGCQEVVLTGTQLGSYGFDLENTDIADLVRNLLERTEVPRIRISSLQPQDISDDLLALWNDPRLCPHFHVPLQSGSDSVLKTMRRRYTSAEFQRLIRQVKEVVPGVAVTADAIVGFPGETESDFQETVSACIQAGLASVHVFPYSIRPGTSAAYFDDQVDPTVKSGRVKELTAVVDDLARRFREASVGQTRPVLWERATSSDKGMVWQGLTDNYLRTRTQSESDLANRITLAVLESFDGDVMNARIPGEQPLAWDGSTTSS